MLVSLFALAACSDETVSGYADPDAIYVLQSISGEPFAARATLRFPERGRIAGQAPCNAYSASQSAPYPWFEPGPIAATRRACPEGEAERRFLAALADMRVAEVSGPVLILTDADNGAPMVFRAGR